MKVFLLDDVEKIGARGEILNVSDGYASNYLFPKKLAVAITPANEAQFAKRAVQLEKRQEVVATKTSLLAERIKNLKLTLKRKTHDSGKLYGSIAASDLAELLTQEGVTVSKSQILYDKSIKETGSYEITVKLTSRLQPAFTLKVIAE
jgi:large subunit ribosomal protein L9